MRGQLHIYVYSLGILLHYQAHMGVKVRCLRTSGHMCYMQRTITHKLCQSIYIVYIINLLNFILNNIRGSKGT